MCALLIAQVRYYLLRWMAHNHNRYIYFKGDDEDKSFNDYTTDENDKLEDQGKKIVKVFPLEFLLSVKKFHFRI